MYLSTTQYTILRNKFFGRLIMKLIIKCILKFSFLSRHMAASRDINAGEIILEEQPLTFGPVCSTGGEKILPLCLGCYRPVDGSFLCSECGLPMCCQECCNMQQHKDWICTGLRRKGSWWMLHNSTMTRMSLHIVAFLH